VAAGDLADRYVGCLLGLAVGDALGYPVEFAPEEDLLASPVRDFRPLGSAPPGTFSDDTQMTIALARALLRAGDADLDGLMRAVAEEFVAWARSPENNRAPGNTCLAGCHNLARGLPWRQSGVPGSKGCGAAMRSAPVGLYYLSDEPRLVEVGRAQALCTHAHAVAEAGGVATAYLVWLAAQGVDPGEYPARLAATTGPISREFADCIERTASVVDQNQREAYLHITQGSRQVGWVAEEAVGAALWCFLQAPEDFSRVVLLAANSPLAADRDSIACIAGAVAGARVGAAGIPPRWRQGVEKADLLANLGQELLTAATKTRP